jgi:putative ABC transport system permease protein
MWILRALRLRLRHLRRGRLHSDLEDEIGFHLEMAARDKIASGSELGDARTEARKDFGNVTALKERSRDVFRFVIVETILQDVLYAFRTLRRSPGFTAAAAITLALGSGANLAVFSVVKTVLLNQLPFRDPGRLVMLGEADSGEKRPETVGFTTAYDWRRLSRSFESMSLYRDGDGAIVERGNPELLRGMRVSYDFFQTLGLTMQIGRTFFPEEDHPDTRYEVVLSHSLWIRRFGGDPGVLGQTIHLSGSTFKIVGVLSTDLRNIQIPGYPASAEIFSPLGYALSDPFACRDCEHLHLIARLRTGISIAQGYAELNAIMADLVRQYPGSYPAEAKVALQPLHEYLVGSASRPLWLLQGAVGFVLLIACANVANLMLVRAGNRAKEIALRGALGAARMRLLCQLLVESTVLAMVGGGIGILIGRWVLPALISRAPAEIPRIADVRVDGTMLLVGFAASLLTAMLFGLAPAIRASKIEFSNALKDEGKVTGHRLSNALVTSEVTLAFVLLLGVGLLGQSLIRLMGVDPGFDARNVLTLKTYVYGSRYKQAGAELNYYRRALEKLRAMPGIENAAMTSALPLADFDRYGFHVRDRKLLHDSEAPSADTYSVTPGYFATMKIPLLRGRLFNEWDGPDAPRVAIISETCAREQFPNENPIGKQIQLGGRDEKKPWITIVGVVGDIRQYGLDVTPRLAAYIVQAQDLSFGYSLVARTKGDPLEKQRAIQTAFFAVDPALPVFQIRSLRSYEASSLAQRSFTVTLLTCFGALALGLAAVGIYGVISYSVVLRTREIGIRMALGADRRTVLMKTLGEGARLGATGLLLGFAISLVLTRLLSNLLFEVHPFDQATTAGAAIVLCAVALAASFLPAKRAATIDPMTALRSE